MYHNIMCYLLLQCNGKPITWQHVEDLYKRDTISGTGLRLVPKLQFEHIYLLSFSKMRVDLAAQVHVSLLSMTRHRWLDYGCIDTLQLQPLCIRERYNDYVTSRY